MGIRASSNLETVRKQIEERLPGTYMPNTFGVFIFGIEETPYATEHGFQNWDNVRTPYFDSDMYWVQTFPKKIANCFG